MSHLTLDVPPAVSADQSGKSGLAEDLHTSFEVFVRVELRYKWINSRDVESRSKSGRLLFSRTHVGIVERHPNQVKENKVPDVNVDTLC